MARGAGPKYTAAEIASWPEDHKGCKTCKEVLPLKKFGRHNHGLLGKANVCRECRSAKGRAEYPAWRDAHTTAAWLFRGAKGRASNKGLEFSITLDDIVIPERCPVLDVPLAPGTEYAPSLDRTDSSRGYVPGNVAVMSRRANLLKNNGSAEEFRKVLDYLESLT